MKIKDGASIEKITPSMREGATTVAECYAAFGAECVVTSGDERETLHRGHPVEGGVLDPHYEGLALDFRLWNVPPGSRSSLVAQITRTLGNDYVTLWEIGVHTLRYYGAQEWRLTCAASGHKEHITGSLPEVCTGCEKTIQGATPHLHVQAGHVA